MRALPLTMAGAGNDRKIAFGKSSRHGPVNASFSLIL